MDKPFEIIRKTRQNILNQVSELTIDQLNEIPAGFNNNIIWNLAHMVAAQQGVCYVRGGLPLVIKEEFFLAYKPDTKPQGPLSAAQFEEIKQLMFSTIDVLEADYKKGLFKNNPSWTNRYGIELPVIEDSLHFLLFHEGIHFGYIMALKRMVKK